MAVDTERLISAEALEAANAPLRAALHRDFAHLGEQLDRRGLSIEALTEQAAAFSIALPSWGVGTGGTRFARFPGPGEPRNVHEKLQDCAVIQQLVTCTPRVSLHFPWDHVSDFPGLRDFARALDLGFDAVNSNTFQDQPGQMLSYKFGSLTHTDPQVRAQAVEHNLQCIAWGEALGAKALTVWLADGSNHPGQQHLAKALDRYLASMREIYAHLPDDWLVFIEHKMFEPAFYSTVIQDWGTSILCAMELGSKARSLVDLGHHAPNVNIEMIVARLIQFGKLGGFHFNDSQYGDDDLDSGSLHPYRQFLIFNELVDAQVRGQANFAPCYMLDQSHNVTDPVESLMNAAMAVQRSFVQALLVDRVALEAYQQDNDAIMAANTLKAAFHTDVSPILAMARARLGGAIDPIRCFREAGYRASVAGERPAVRSAGSGIV